MLSKSFKFHKIENNFIVFEIYIYIHFLIYCDIHLLIYILMSHHMKSKSVIFLTFHFFVFWPTTIICKNIVNFF
jgi:hypothetical protein